MKKIGDRDIVDFVELNQFDPITLRNKSGLTLESDTLEEIPLHFKRFVKIHSIVPPNHENFSNNKNNNNNNNYNVDNKEMELDHEYDEKQQQAYNQSNNNNYYNGSHKRAPSHSVSGVPSAPNAPNGPTAPPQDAMGTHYGKGYNTVATGGGGAKNASQSESEEDEDEEEDDDNGKEQEKQVSGGSCQCCVLM